MSAFGYGNFKAASKAKAPELAAAVALQGQLDTQAQARVDALRGQNMNAVGNIANKGYGMYKDGAFDSMFQPATDLGIEAGANTLAPEVAADLGMEAGANSLIGTGTGGGIGAAPAAGVANPMAASVATEAAGATAAELAAAELATGVAGSAAGTGVGTAAGAAAGASAAAPAAAGLGGLGAAASTAFPPLALALLASQLFG